MFQVKHGLVQIPPETYQQILTRSKFDREKKWFGKSIVNEGKVDCTGLQHNIFQQVISNTSATLHVFQFNQLKILKEM